METDTNTRIICHLFTSIHYGVFDHIREYLCHMLYAIVCVCTQFIIIFQFHLMLVKKLTTCTSTTTAYFISWQQHLSRKWLASASATLPWVAARLSWHGSLWRCCHTLGSKRWPLPWLPITTREREKQQPQHIIASSHNTQTTIACIILLLSTCHCFREGPLYWAYIIT